MRKHILAGFLVALFATGVGLPAVKASSEEIFEHEWIVKNESSPWEQHTFKPHGNHTYVQFSGYRIAKDKFAAPGLSRVLSRENYENKTCYWYGRKGQNIFGLIEVAYEAPAIQTMGLGKKKLMSYEAIALLCNLEGPTDNKGGHVVTKIFNETFVLYSEEPHTFLESSMDPKEPFRHRISFCGLRLYGRIIPSQVKNFIDYYRVRFGMDFFNFYDTGGIDSSLIKMLQPYLDKEMVSVTNFRGVHKQKTRHHGQSLSIADCTYRSRFDSKWVFFGDMDEYFDPIFPNAMDSLLAKYSNEAWMSHQGYEWDVKKCKKEEGQEGEGENDFPIGKMVVREKYPFGKRVLTKGTGHRKLIVNPRLINIPSIHYVYFAPPGIDLDPYSQARHHHYRGWGAITFKDKICSEPVEVNTTTSVEDEYMSHIISFVRKCLSGTPVVCFDKLQQRFSTLP